MTREKGMIQRQRPQQQQKILPQIIFLALTFLAAVSGTYVALTIYEGQREGAEIPQIITVEVIYTTTPLPTKLATALPAAAQRSQVDLPVDIAAEAEGESERAIDPGALGARDVVISTPTPSIAGGPIIDSTCEFYSVLAGDSAYFIALRKGVELDDLLRANGLTVNTATSLQIGQRLLIPHAGCRVDERTGEPLPVTLAPTSTPLPTATSTPPKPQFELQDAQGLGDITAEAIRLQNIGGNINISDWTLSDSDGNIYKFRDVLLFPQTGVVLYTRSGTSTANARFWGRDESVWSAGEELTLADPQGRIVQTLQLPAPDAGE